MEKAVINVLRQNIRSEFENRNLLVSYLRNPETRTPYGVVVATRNADGEVVFGYSVCNTKVDPYNKYMGLSIAIDRARSGKAPSHFVNTSNGRKQVSDLPEDALFWVQRK